MLQRNRTYGDLLGYARRVVRRADEAEDLLQVVLLAAHEAGRLDLSSADNRRWMMGALRRRAAFDARSALRRRRREAAVATGEHPGEEVAPLPTAFVAGLPAALRTTTLLVLCGHTRAETAHLLGITDAALRQRIADIRRRWRAAGGQAVTELTGLHGSLAFGRIRRELLGLARHGGGFLASHDPDGHLFAVRSQTGASRQQGHATPTSKE